MQTLVDRQARILKYVFWIAMVAWTLVLGGLLTWQIHYIRSMNWEMARAEARANFNKDQAFRLWATKHGGVYVPATAETPPNPRLDHIPERDIETPSGKQLTLMNPAYMVRQLNEQFRELYGVVGHITSTRLLREENAPDDWERAALEAFEGGTEEVLSVAQINGTPYLRLMQPMIAQEGCLKCHGHQGYEVGDVRGGVSAAVPLKVYFDNMRDGTWVAGASFGALWLLGLGGLGAGHRRLQRDAAERLRAEEDVRQLNAELEQRVTRRTEELQDANRALHTSLDELQRAKDHLVQSEKLAALGELVAGVAHEINTPVGIGVTAASHLELKTREVGGLHQGGKLKRSDLESYLKTASESAGAILSNLTRAAELIRSFKQVAVDQSTQERRTFKLKEYIDGVLLSLRPKLKKTRHQVVVECPDDLELDTYPGAFSQILTNLVMNSLIHAFADQEQGEIRIRAAREAGTLELRYSDNGCGMDDAIRSRIFEPFYTTRRGQGASGLGLHIVYNLVTQFLGGRITCESAPGRGTTFILHIPQRGGDA